MDTKSQDEPAEPAGSRQATLRRGAASLTETARRAPFDRRGGRARKDAP
ncbi:DUF6380 family protein [Streptomyces shenzhenensis]|uniref:Uncharacterized protein n=1 Tax=Streptomyces shenzhenensis TaxID=943815 RepID=A0A3M0IIB9_9ACTN|nr:DUF6380 family protein [Streptomyces shenzhenensis]RMB81676.1 hypothetical protein CTZ28_33005 [Streptomyces shenzhenensis]